MPDASSFTPDLPGLDDAAYQRALAVVLDVGTSLAQELKAPAPDLTVIQRAGVFPNVATTIRRTIILSRHIAGTPAAEAANPASERARARTHIIRTVEDTIGQDADPAEAGELRLELLERLDSPEFDLDLKSRTPHDLIQELCRDLGLSNRPYGASYLRRTPDDVAILSAQAAALSGSNLTSWHDTAALEPPADPNPSPGIGPPGIPPPTR